MKRTLFALSAAAIATGAMFLILKLREPAPPEAAVPVTAAPVAPLAAAAAAPAPSPEAEFQKKIDSAQETLPTSEKISALPEEQVHSTPRPLLDASLEIGEIAETILKNPALGAQGMEFYGKCARRGELAVSVRAHCLHNLRALGKTRGETPDEGGIADGVLKLEGPAKE